MRVSAKIRYDFNCDACGHWWSVVDMNWEKGKRIACPHCHCVERLPDNPMLKPNFCIDSNLFRQNITDAGFSNLFEDLPTGEIRSLPEGMIF